MWRPCSFCRLRQRFTHLGLGECLAMLVFLLQLIEGLAWAYQKKVLDWA